MTRPSTHGPSIYEMLWNELDARVAQAYAHTSKSSKAPSDLAGEIKGIITCIAIMMNPYSPNPKAIRSEAIKRYKENQS